MPPPMAVGSRRCCRRCSLTPAARVSTPGGWCSTPTRSSSRSPSGFTTRCTARWMPDPTLAPPSTSRAPRRWSCRLLGRKLVAEQHQVTWSAEVVDGVVDEHPLATEAEPHEDVLPAVLFLDDLDDLDDQLLQRQLATCVDDRRCQCSANAPAPIVGTNHEGDVADVALPAGQLPDVGVADDLVADHRNELAPVASLNGVDQPHDRGIGLQVDVEVEPVVLGECGTEREQLREVGLAQPADDRLDGRRLDDVLNSAAGLVGHDAPIWSQTNLESREAEMRSATSLGSPSPSTSRTTLLPR